MIITITRKVGVGAGALWKIFGAGFGDWADWEV
jgi:hypothetical protein